MCNCQETGKQASCATVTGNRLCASLGPALLRPTGRDRFTELWKLGFPFLHLAGTIFWRWFSLSLQAGRKVICKLRVTCHCGRRQEGWLMLPDRIPRSWVASPGAEVFTVGKKGQEERGNWVAGCSIGAAAQQVIAPLSFSVLHHFSCIPPLLRQHHCSCAGISQSRSCWKGNQPQNKCWDARPWWLMAVHQQRESRWSGWLEDRWHHPNPQVTESSVKPTYLETGSLKCALGRAGESDSLCSQWHGGKRWSRPLPSPTWADPVYERKMLEKMYTRMHTHTSHLPLKLNWTPKT